MNSSDLIIPNQHVALVHFPLALLMVGVLIELVCAIGYRQSSARAAGRWMILLGAAFGWPAVYTGLFALRDVAIAGMPDLAEGTWNQMRAGSPALSKPATWDALRNHLLIAGGAIAAANLVVIVWLMAGERLRRSLYVPAMIILLVSCAAIGMAAWFAGEIVYWHDATRIAESPGINGQNQRPIDHTVRAVVPPLQTHVTLAGCVTGLALLTWGVAARTRRVPETVSEAAATLPPDPAVDRIFAAFQPATIETSAEPPSAALGWLTLLAVLATGALGLWSLADSFESWKPVDLMKAVLDTDNKVGPVSRRLAHAIGALVIAVVAILVAIAGKRSRRGRILPLLIGTLLFAAVIAQTWFGLLLLFDTNGGSLVKPNAE